MRQLLIFGFLFACFLAKQENLATSGHYLVANRAIWLWLLTADANAAGFDRFKLFKGV